MRFEVPAETRTVVELLEEMRSGRLDLNPPFQRRSVWRPIEKSYLMDTVIRGLPIPLVILRHRLDVEKRERIIEVADGQQRLRTLFSFIEPDVIDDFDEKVDRFTIRKTHNDDPAINSKPFAGLPSAIRRDILEYRISVVFLPTSMEDRDVLDLFARLNSTGLRLTAQELRNANFFGELKSTMYRIARENLERWARWKLLTPQEIARMKDVELISDITNLMLNGLRPKTKAELDRLYEKYDEKFTEAREVGRRTEQLFAAIDGHAEFIASSVFSKEMHFVTLIAAMYSKLWGLNSRLQRIQPSAIGSKFWKGVQKADLRYERGQVPKSVASATQGAATDLKRREIRLRFLLDQINAD